MDSTEQISATDGPWDKHKDFWLGLATQVGATAQQAKFAFALATGHSQSSAAKFAGYAGEPRTQGYSTARTKRVKSMLVLAEADGWQSPSDTVDEPTKVKLLNALMRSTDPSVRLRAIELADKRQERERERAREAATVTYDPIATLTELAHHDAELAVRLARAYGIGLPAEVRALAEKELAARRAANEGAHWDKGRTPWREDSADTLAEPSGEATVNGAARPASAADAGK